MRIGMLGMMAALMGAQTRERIPLGLREAPPPAQPKQTRLFWGRYWDAAKEAAAQALTRSMKKYEIYTRQQSRRDNFLFEFQKVTSEVNAPRAVRRRIARNRLRLRANSPRAERAAA